MNMSNNKKDKVKGALYGFAIGDSMGATTEFMSKESIKKQYRKVNDLIGGGWLNTIPGEVTDDTQMTMCIVDAILENEANKFKALKKIADNFVKWYNSMPKDIGGACSNGIRNYIITKSLSVPYNEDTLGNGSLMRALPFALLMDNDMNVMQGRITHNNHTVDYYIIAYSNLIESIINQPASLGELIMVYGDNERLYDPSGHVMNSFKNALYWFLHTKTFEESIIGPVNHGGDADTIAAITGGLTGAYYGYNNIPKKWINKLDKNICKKLDLFCEKGFTNLKN